MVIVAAVDQSNRAARVVKEAKELSTAFDDSVHVVHALTKSDMVKMEGIHATKPDIQITDNEAREVATEVASRVVADFDMPSESVGLVGDAKSAITSYASEQNARYIVVAGRKRSPAGKTVFGSVAQSIILNSECPTVVSVEQ